MSDTHCGQPITQSSLGCYTAHGSTSSVTIEILRTFMPDPAHLGKTILTETRYVMPSATGPMPFVPNFVAGDVIAIGACPLPTVVTQTFATGDLQNAWYTMPDGSVVAIKVVTEVGPDGTLTVLGFTIPTLTPITPFDPTKLVVMPVVPCPTPTNNGINSSW
jgi:hypothetical protein